MLQQLLTALRANWPELAALSFSLVRMWLLRRQTKWQRELLVRQRLLHIESQNETVKTMSTAYATEEPLTLDDLLSSVDRDLSLRSSERHSTPPPTPRDASYHRFPKR